MKKHIHRNQPAGRTSGDGKPGYKNIDPKHRWVKGGPSPNPEGRRRKPPPSQADEIFDDLVGLLKGTVPTETGERLTVFQGLFRRLVGGALNDSKLALKVVPLLLELLHQLQPEVASDDDGEVTADDAELIAETLARLSTLGGRSNG